MSSILYEDTLDAGCHWSMTVRRGHSLRLIDNEGGANVGMLMYNPMSPLERINVPDTLKCQHTFKLTKGNCIYSDMGRVFCSITEDSAGWHDAACGTCKGGFTLSKSSDTHSESLNVDASEEHEKRCGMDLYPLCVS